MLRPLRRTALVVLIGGAMFGASTLPAWAWHANVSGQATCDGSTVTVSVPDESWVEDDTTASGSVSLAGQSKAWQISGAGSTTVSFPGVNGGTASVDGSFNTGESAGGSVSIAAATDCEPVPTPEPPTTTTPPTTVPPKPEKPRPPVEKPEKPKPVAGTAKEWTRPEKPKEPEAPRPNYTPPEFDGSTGPTPFTG